jgi:hypothetical protein
VRLTHWLAIAALGLAQSSSGLGGIWSLNRSVSEFPKELGFNIDTGSVAEPTGSTTPTGPSGSSANGRARRGSGGGRASGSPFVQRRESYEDAQRLKLITDEVRNPPTRLVIVDNAAAIAITNELGQSRTLHPTGREETIEIQGVLVPVTTVRDGARLVVSYHVEPDRDVRYTYTATAVPARLTVETAFLEHGSGDKVTRVYDAGIETVAAVRPPAASAPVDLPRERFDQRPGAEFKGLKDIGILVEDLGPEARACGLKGPAIEESLARKLTAGGLNVRRNSDEDTYLYVNIITNSTPTGSCTTRYDAFLYTHGTAKLSYRDQPVLVQVSLMHRGGIGTSGIATHAAAVSRELDNYVDLFLTQIRDANK